MDLARPAPLRPDPHRRLRLRSPRGRRRQAAPRHRRGRLGLAGLAEGPQQAQDGSIAVRTASWKERGLLLAGAALGTLAVGGLFTLFPHLSWSPWADAYIFVGTIVAMVAQARGLVEFWFAWLLVDLVGVPLAFNNGLAFSGLVYVVYFALVLWGAYDWYQRSRRTPAPALEGATA